MLKPGLRPSGRQIQVQFQGRRYTCNAPPLRQADSGNQTLAPPCPMH